MEKQHFTSNQAFANAATDRDRQLAFLFYDICEFFGLPVGLPEKTNNSSQELEYLLAISG